MKKLEKTIDLSRIGLKVTSTEVKREKDVAMYKRSDGVYEVFKVKTEKARKVFGKSYPEREVYPSNEDFGISAWCYFSKENLAIRKFNSLLNS